MNISDKLSKVDESLQIYMYDNGYMVEVSGQDQDQDYRTARILCTDLAEVHRVVEEAATMERT